MLKDKQVHEFLLRRAIQAHDAAKQVIQAVHDAADQDEANQRVSSLTFEEVNQRDGDNAQKEQEAEQALIETILLVVGGVEPRQAKITHHHRPHVVTIDGRTFVVVSSEPFSITPEGEEYPNESAWMELYETTPDRVRSY
jgi:hypothetical protein